MPEIFSWVVGSSVKMDINTDFGRNGLLEGTSFRYSYEDSVSLFPAKEREELLRLPDFILPTAVSTAFYGKLSREESETRIFNYWESRSVTEVLADLYCTSDDLLANPSDLSPFSLALDNFTKFTESLGGDDSYIIPTRYLTREYLFSDYADYIFACSERIIAVGVYGDYIAGKKNVYEMKVCVLSEGERVLDSHEYNRRVLSEDSIKDIELLNSILQHSTDFEENSKFFSNIKFDIDQGNGYYLKSEKERGSLGFHIELRVSPLMIGSFITGGVPQLWVVNCAKTKEKVAFYCSGKSEKKNKEEGKAS